MALTTCPECGRRVSSSAATCPQCGYAPYASQPHGYPPASSGGYPGYAPEVHATAKTAMWLGVSSLFCGITGPLGLLFGLSAQKQIKAAPGRYKNGGHATAAVITGGIGTVFLLIALVANAGKKDGATSAADASGERTQAAAAQPASGAEPPTYISASCLELATSFGPQSKLSDLQKEELWPQYRGKFFKWQLEVTEVSSDTFGGYTVQFKCSPKSPSFIQDIQLEYEDDAKSFVMGLQKKGSYEITGKLGSTSTLLGMTGDGVP